MTTNVVDTRTDGRLVTRAQRGDREAFATLYERYFDPIYDYLVRLTRSRELAADLSQDAFIRAMQRLEQLDEPEAFKGWIYRIARSQALNRLEREGRSIATAPVEDDEEGLNPLLIEIDHDRLTSPAMAAEVEESAALVWEAAAGLDERTYTVLDLTVRHGLDSAEIAEVMGVSVGNGYTMVSRMKDRVEAAIGAYVMARRTDQDCADLRAVVGATELPPMTVELARAVNTHVDACETCDSKRRKLLSPANVFAAFAAVASPDGLASDVWEEIDGRWEAEGPSGGSSKWTHLAVAAAAFVAVGTLGVINATPVTEVGVDVLAQEIDNPVANDSGDAAGSGDDPTTTSGPTDPPGVDDGAVDVAGASDDGDRSVDDTTTATDAGGETTTTTEVETTTTTEAETTTTTGAETTTTTAADTTTTTAASNEAPTATITVPSGSVSLCLGGVVTLMGEGTDPEDGDLTGSSVEWSSDLEGALGTGTQYTFQPTVPGIHEVTFEATDSGGLTASDLVRVETLQGPAINILTPPDGTHYVTDARVLTIEMAASVTDDIDTGLAVSWESDVDGFLDTGNDISAALTGSVAGVATTHVITASVTDSDGCLSQASVTIVIGPEA